MILVHDIAKTFYSSVKKILLNLVNIFINAAIKLYNEVKKILSNRLNLVLTVSHVLVTTSIFTSYSFFMPICFVSFLVGLFLPFAYVMSTLDNIKKGRRKYMEKAERSFYINISIAVVCLIVADATAIFA